MVKAGSVSESDLDQRCLSMPGKCARRNPSLWMAHGAIFVIAAVAGLAVGRFAAAREPLPRVFPLFASGTTILGEAVAYPADAPAKITAAIVTLAPGEETGWHTHGMPTFGYILEGELAVDYGDQGTRIYKAGDAILEAIRHPHNGRNKGHAPMRILAVFMGAEGVPTSTPAGPPARP